jgi:hypothetical protein
LSEEIRLTVYENRELRRIFGHKRNDVTGEWINFKMRSLMTCTDKHILFGISNNGKR